MARPHVLEESFMLNQLVVCGEELLLEKEMFIWITNERGLGREGVELTLLCSCVIIWHSKERHFAHDSNLPFKDTYFYIFSHLFIVYKHIRRQQAVQLPTVALPL